MRIPTALSALLLAAIPQCLAWGSLGHRTVAYLASLYLTPEATIFTNQLLNGQDISEAALFPDKVAHIPAWAYSRQWHYIDANDSPPSTCSINITTDCIPGGCVVSAIANHTSRAMDTNLPRFLRGQSLRFVTHFIGDVHQPLHTEKLSHGGNGVEVLFDGKRTNLHSVWDTAMPNKYRKREEWGGGGRESEEEAAFLWAQELMQGDKEGLEVECTRDAAECALEWAEQSNQYVCSIVLRDGVEGVEGKELGGEYYEEAIEVINASIRRGGRRLAAWLNLMAASNRKESEEMFVQDL